jgi:hypothetical protein
LMAAGVAYETPQRIRIAMVRRDMTGWRGCGLDRAKVLAGGISL